MINTKKTTIKDVAAAANVSIGTVDRVMHSRGGVSKETEEKIRRIARELNYSPSSVARALVAKRNPTKIAVVYPDAEPHFWSQVEKGIQDFEKSYAFYGVEVIPFKTSSYRIDDQIKLFEEFSDSDIKGVAAIPYNSYKLDPYIAKLVQNNITVNTFISDAPNSLRECYTGLDDVAAGQIAANLMGLYLQGRGKIAIMGVHRDVLCIENRILGFISSVHKNFPNLQLERIFNTRMLSDAHENLYIEEMNELSQHVLKTNPDLAGIYVTNSMTEHVAKVIQQENMGDQIVVIGHELSNDIIRSIEEGVINASIYQNPRRVVYRCLKRLYKSISGKQKPSSTTNYIFPHIVNGQNVPFVKDIYTHDDWIF